MRYYALLLFLVLAGIGCLFYVHLSHLNVNNVISVEKHKVYNGPCEHSYQLPAGENFLGFSSTRYNDFVVTIPRPVLVSPQIFTVRTLRGTPDYCYTIEEQ